MTQTPTQTELPPQYDPASTEASLYKEWLDAGLFTADPAKSRRNGGDKDPFVIVMPPPNVTAVLHMGHGLNNTVQDVVIRWRRMCGDEALWVPGTDHAGIATQNVIEKQLAAEGLFDVARKKAIPMLPQRIAVVTSAGKGDLKELAKSEKYETLHLPDNVALFIATPGQLNIYWFDVDQGDSQLRVGPHLGRVIAGDLLIIAPGEVVTPGPAHPHHGSAGVDGWAVFFDPHVLTGSSIVPRGSTIGSCTSTGACMSRTKPTRRRTLCCRSTTGSPVPAGSVRCSTIVRDGDALRAWERAHPTLRTGAPSR